VRWKSTIVLLLVTVAVGAYVSLYELKQPTPEQRAELVKQLFDIPPETVTRLVMELPQGQVAVKREGGAWLLEPEGVRADQELIGRILQMLSPLRAERTLFSDSPEQSVQAHIYGLEPPHGKLTIVSPQGATSLLVGEVTPVNDNRYVRVEGQPEIHVVSGGLFELADQPAVRFRDPRLVRFEAFDADELTITSPALTIALRRIEDSWRITGSNRIGQDEASQFTDRADRSEVNGLLGSLGQLAIKRYITDAPAPEQLAALGLQDPKTVVRLKMRGAQEPLTIAFGSLMLEDKTLVYARRSDEPSIYAVETAAMETLLRDPHGLRSTLVFEFAPGTARQVEIVGLDKTRMVIERTDQGWREATTGQTLETGRVEGLLRTLADLHAAGFVDDAPDLKRYALDTPRGSISIWLADRDAPQQLLLGAVIEGTANRYGLVAGRHAVVRLPELASTLVSLTVDGLRPPQPAAPPAAAPAAPAVAPQAAPPQTP
jgi:hypothetical protein